MELPKGERLNLIKEIAAALADDPLSEIELTLDTFGVPDPDQWDHWSDDKGYTITRLRHAKDDTLVELHAHLGSEGSSEAGPVGAGPWEDGMFRLFLSHTSGHRLLCKEIRDHLRRYGIDTFVAHEMIKPTREWEEEIELALATCEGMLALVTPDFIESEYCDQEVGYAMGRGQLIVAVMQGAAPYGFVSKWQGLPGQEGDGAAQVLAEAIFDVLFDHDKSGTRMAAAVADRYANSTSFENAKANTRILMRIPKERWTEAMIEQVERAGAANSQVSECFYGLGRAPAAVSRRLDELFDRKPEPRPAKTVPMTDGAAAGNDISF